MDYRYDKWPLPRGLSYPLGRDTLDAALEKTRVKQLAEVAFAHPKAMYFAGDLAIAWFGGEERRLLTLGQTGLRISAVPSGEKRHTRSLLEAALPRLGAWLAMAEQSEGTWRISTHCLRLTVHDGESVWLEDVFDGGEPYFS